MGLGLLTGSYIAPEVKNDSKQQFMTYYIPSQQAGREGVFSDVFLASYTVKIFYLFLYYALKTTGAPY